MAELTCPLCGSPVRVPRVETNTRYFCKKCHSPFHLNKARVAVVGEPPDVEVELQELKQKLRQNLDRVPVRKVVAGLVALVVVCVGLYYLLRPAQSLEGPAEKAGRGLRAKDPGAPKAMGRPRAAAEVGRW